MQTVRTKLSKILYRTIFIKQKVINLLCILILGKFKSELEIALSHFACRPGESVTSAISNLAAAAQSAGNAQTSDENAENYFFDVGDVSLVIHF